MSRAAWWALLAIAGVVVITAPGLPDPTFSTLSTVTPGDAASLMVRIAVGLWVVRLVVLSFVVEWGRWRGPSAFTLTASRSLPRVGQRLMKTATVGVVMASLVVPASAGAHETGSQPTATAPPARAGSVDPSTTSSSDPPTTETPPVAQPTLVLLDDGWPELDYPVTLADLGPIETGLVETAATDRTSTWTVQPGDHLWSIAASIAPAHADLDEIGRNWVRLVEHNRTALPDPSNPDLILPGMVIDVPEWR